MTASSFAVQPVTDTDRCEITLTLKRQSLLIWEGLLMWFDALGDQADQMRAECNDGWDWSMASTFRRQALALL
ncbi:hypothetical protein FZX02_06300 [Synechococcus sp. MU1644]|nr:hypothetical protein [Synechococcus sp. MU1644]